MGRRLSRRDMLKAPAALAAAALAGGRRPSMARAQQGRLPDVAPGAVNPLGLEAGSAVEGVFFEGGFGRAYLDNAADIFRALHPDNAMSVDGIQRVAEVLGPRFAAGNPPDVIDNSGAFRIPMDSLVADDELADLSPLLAAPSLDSPGVTFAATLFPGSQVDGVHDGRQLWLNITLTVTGVWYSQRLFEERGWDYPRTWDGMLELCETIRAAGIAPWTYQGRYPEYMVFGCLMPLIHKVGGIDAILAIDNLEQDAWRNDAVREAVGMMHQLGARGYIMPGSEELTHIEAQTEWLRGRAAFIPCGTWLENEMRAATPAGFDMVLKPLPGPEESARESLVTWPDEPFIVPVRAANAAGGMEFLRCLLSRASARYFAGEVSAIMPVLGGSEGVEPGPALKSALDAAAAADGGFRFLYPTWYSDLSRAVNRATGELLQGRMSPEEFVAAVQAVADAVRADDDIPKYRRA